MLFIQLAFNFSRKPGNPDIIILWSPLGGSKTKEKASASLALSLRCGPTLTAASYGSTSVHHDYRNSGRSFPLIVPSHRSSGRFDSTTFWNIVLLLSTKPIIPGINGKGGTTPSQASETKRTFRLVDRAVVDLSWIGNVPKDASHTNIIVFSKIDCGPLKMGLENSS